jgi:hypothetical protein
MSEKKSGMGDLVLGKLDINYLMRKAAATDVISTDEVANSILSRQQADAFIDLTVDTSKLLKSVRTAKTDVPSGEINKMDLGEIVTESVNATGTATHKPTASKIDYDTEKVRSCFDITSDFTEDNLEGPAARDKLLNMFTKRIAIDFEILGLEGDESLFPANADGTKKQRLCGSNDGFIKILTANVPAGQQVDALGQSPSTALYYTMKRKLPTRYRVAKPDYRWITGSSTVDKWNFDLTQYKGDVTAGLSAPSTVQAQYREMEGGGKPLNIPMVEVPLMPEDISYTIGAKTYTDGSYIIMTPMMNLIFFVQRDITIEWDRIPRQDKWEVTIHSRVDFQVENRDMVVLAKNVGVNGADYMIP